MQPAEKTPAAKSPAQAHDLAHLRRSIAQRKRFDRFFGILGTSLVAISLLTLAVLFAKLCQDGWQALTQTYQAKADQSGFGRKELIGQLDRQSDQWTLALRPLVLEGVDDGKLQPLLGQRVGVSGKMGRAPDSTFEPKTVEPVAGDAAAYQLAGTLSREILNVLDNTGKTVPKAVYTLKADPLRLDVSAIDSAALAPGDVSVDPSGTLKGGAVAASAVTPLITKGFFNSFPSRDPKEAGILSAWVGTLLIMFVTMIVAIPLGVASGIYLEEYATKNRFTALIEVNIANLAGVPSIIWGLLALGLFVYVLGTGRSVQTAGLTLGLLVLPIVIISTREAIRSIPGTIREASIGLGATKWQTVRHHVLPYSMPGILTGSIIAMSRAIGETAPLVTIGALTFIAFLPSPPIDYRVPAAEMAVYEQAIKADPATPMPAETLHLQPTSWLKSGFTVLPIQLFQWVSRPQKEFHNNAAAAGVILLAMTLSMNGIAIYLRYRLRRNLKW
ncbi:MAG TPA: phosphate ABC transporter permease PstA [Tepidisphaeraceae bacterium]|jgi:phosphate transport system permease protein